MEQLFDYAFILGATPELSLAEIQSVVHPTLLITDKHLVGLVHHQTQLNPEQLMQRLGGTVKIAHLTQTHARLEQIDLHQLSQLVPHTTARALFGLSIYQVEPVLSAKQLAASAKQLGLELKAWFKEHGRGARLVTNQDGSPLSAVTIDKEKLLTKGREIILVIQRHHIHVGVTMAVQPYEDWGQRDFGRPARSMKTGMLPPKVARMMVNLAEPQAEDRLLDPFVGTGTILQEALLMGFQKIEGNDVDPRALSFTRQNLAWLKLPQVKLHQYKAERLTHHLKSGVYDRIIFEGYLGPLDERRVKQKINEITQELTDLYAACLPEFSRLLKPGGRLVGAFPAWRITQHTPLQTLPIADLLLSAGFKVVAGPFVYGRTDAFVLREIWVLDKPLL